MTYFDGRPVVGLEAVSIFWALGSLALRRRLSGRLLVPGQGLQGLDRLFMVTVGRWGVLVAATSLALSRTHRDALLGAFRDLPILGWVLIAILVVLRVLSFVTLWASVFGTALDDWRRLDLRTTRMWESCYLVALLAILAVINAGASS